MRPVAVKIIDIKNGITHILYRNKTLKQRGYFGEIGESVTLLFDDSRRLFKEVEKVRPEVKEDPIEGTRVDFKKLLDIAPHDGIVDAKRQEVRSGIYRPTFSKYYSEGDSGKDPV